MGPNSVEGSKITLDPVQVRMLVTAEVDL